MTTAVLRDFQGATINTKLLPYRLPLGQFQVLENCVVRNGRLEPLNGLGSAETTGLAAGTTWASIFKLNNAWIASGTRRWINAWQDQYVVYVEDGLAPPRLSNGYTETSLGYAAPTTQPTCTASGSGPINWQVSYVVTFVDAFGQESAPTAPVTLTPANQGVAITAIPTGPAGTTDRRIYRTPNGSTAHLRVTSLGDNTTTTYTDTKYDTQLTDALTTQEAGVAPSLQGLAIKPHLARIWGWIGQEVYWSNVGAPWAWSLASIPVDEPVVAMAGTTGGMLVLTAARPYLISGTKETNFTLTPVNNTHGCAAGASLVQTDAGLVWWSKDGLVLYDGSGFRLLSEPYLSSADVAALSTTGMQAAFSDGYYYLFHTDGCLICDIRSGGTFSASTLTVDAVFVDTDGTFYVADGNDVKQWAEGSALTMRVRTAEFANDDTRQPYHLRRIHLTKSGTLTFAYYQDGTAQTGGSGTVPSNGLAWSATGLWNFGACEFSGTGTIEALAINA